MRMYLTAALLAVVQLGASAQSYTYRTEGFEDVAFDTKANTVNAPTGKWTTNKNVRSDEAAAAGGYSIKFAAKAGVMLPELTEGAGTLIYYAKDQNRQANVEVSRDKTTWTSVESYKETSDWTKHTVTINDPQVRWVRISITSNSQYYLDEVLVTKPDGTDGDGNIVVSNLVIPYFTNDFEGSQYPQSKTDCTAEATYNVEGQGEWKYLNAYKATNVSYITDGSARDLRMLKGKSHVITPVVPQGVVKVTFNEGRSGKKVNLYTSKDGGDTWQLLRMIETDTYNEIMVNDRDVDRIKIANEATSGDIDLDNLCVTAFPEGTPASVTTGEVSGITPSSATIGGTVTSPGDRPITERGVCWTIAPGIPDYMSARVIADSSDDSYTVSLTGIPADTKVNARAYVVGLGGAGYGETVSFTTLPAAAPSVKTVLVKQDDFTDEKNIYIVAQGKVLDNGGAAVTATGFVYSTSVSPTETSPRAEASLYGSDFSTSIPLQPSTTYYIRAYATNRAGTSLGEELTITTPAIDIPDYRHNVYYCDPNGDDATADGSAAKPFYSLQKAADIVEPGDTIFMNAGTYEYTSRINISRSGKPNSGNIALYARGGRAVLDFTRQGFGESNQGIRHTASYWHYYGIDICNAGDNGLLIERNKPTGGSYADIAARTDEGHDNVIEFCNFVRNQDTGLQMKNLASYNRVINCDAYYNTDPDHGDADGFAVKISHGTGNYFYGCRAWQNSDDGWDQFIKKDGGFPDDVTTTLEYCWAFENGILENGSNSKGNGNGFKLGSDQGRNNVILNRCLAFDNVNKGFDQNHNTGNMILNNCAGYADPDPSNKSHYTYRLDEPVATDHEIRLTNCVAISDGIADRNKSEFTPYSVNGTLVTCDLNTRPEDYVTISTEGTKAARKADGSLPDTDFLRPNENNTKFIDRGTAVAPYPGESRYSEGILYEGAAPDLGYYESNDNSGIIPVISANADLSLRPVVTAAGDIVITVTGADALSENIITVTDLNGRTLMRRTFTGHTVSIRPNAPAGQILLLSVNGGAASAKVLMSR